MTGALAPGPAGDTIFALASGAGRAAISVVRLSGDRAGQVLAALCRALPPPRHAMVRTLRDAEGAVLDRALVLWMPAPHSYTGEDSAELHLHGGRAILAAVSAALLAGGARPADPGEFTRRAFLAGKMDLLEAEAVADLVAAETQSQRLQALQQLQGTQSRLVCGWSERLKRALAFQEALIDFPDEDLPAGVERQLIADLQGLLQELKEHIRSSASGQRLRDGLTFAIVGPPNVGKSSLLNALAGRDVAIVSPTPGTTRDPLEASLELAGIPVTLIDTAGLRETTDPVEAEGVRRARARADMADLVLHVVEAGTADAGEAPRAGALLVVNKTDLAAAPPGAVGVSVKTGAGLMELEALLAQRAAALCHSAHPVLTRARHGAALRDAASALQASLVAPLPELRAEDLRHALQAIGRLTGASGTDDLLDIVFSAFCIGK